MLKFFRSAALVAFATFALITASFCGTFVQATSAFPHQRSSWKSNSASPLFTGTDGSQTGVAKFQGNYTVITAPSGQVLALSRATNCALLFLTGTYSNGSSFTYTSTGMTPNYERTLHTEAGLTTAADSVPAGCVDPTRGIGARPATYVGKTTSGIMVYAGIFYNFATQAESLYILTGNTSFNVNVLSFSRAGLVTTADLNGDGNGDLIVVNGSNISGTAQVYVMLGNSDGTFGTAIPYTVPGGNSLTAVVDDFNGDGKLDIVATSDNGQVTLLTGKGDGSFNTPQSFAAPTPSYPGSTTTPSPTISNLVSADLRGTGHKDLLASNGLVLLNDGTGKFTAAPTAAFPPVTSPTQGGPYLATGDINRDGKPDLVVSTGDGLLTFTGKGDGTFSPGASYVTINSDGFITVTDLDGDGNPDIYVGDANNGLFRGDSADTNIAYALMGNGDGTFSGAPSIAGNYTGTNLGDVNGDGQQDLIVPVGNNYSVQLGTPKGTFNTASIIPAPPATITAPNPVGGSPVTIVTSPATIGSSYAVGDLNGDGKADLVYLDYNLFEINPLTNNQQGYTGIFYFVSLSNGDGTFRAPIPYAIPQIAPSSGFDITLTADSVHIGDFNHDGKPDLIFNFTDLTGPSSTYLRGFIVLPGIGDGTFGAPIITYTYNSTTAPSSATGSIPVIASIVDINNDGNVDLVAYSSSFVVTNGVGVSTANLQIYLGKGDGTFATTPTTPITSAKLASATVADFNGDGKLDLACLGEDANTQGQLFIALGKGDGTFATPTTLLLQGGDVVPESGLAAADFDGDGKVDLAYLDSESFSGIFYGKGDGTFTSVPISNGQVAPKDLVNLFIGSSAGTIALDLNKDGHPDIINGNAVLLSLYGSATTTPPPPTLTATTTTLTSSANSIVAGGSITFTATITGASGSTGTPTGSVNFLDGTTSLHSVTLTSGAATYTTTALAAGSHSITAVYSGDSTFSTSTSSSLTITVTAPPPPAAFAITLASATGTVARGSNITDTVTITPTGGFNQAVTLACSGAPANSTCTLSPTSVTPNGTAAITSTLTLTADTPIASFTRTRHDFEVAAILPLGLLGSAVIFTLGRRRKINWSLQLLALAIVSTLLAATGCGGSHPSSSTTTPTTNTPTPGTYPLTVTATSGTIAHTATYTVTIQ
jgi:Bacterial Ig-like domain (group 3)/FG-GAP-like repeat